MATALIFRHAPRGAELLAGTVATGQSKRTAALCATVAADFARFGSSLRFVRKWFGTERQPDRIAVAHRRALRVFLVGIQYWRDYPLDMTQV